MARARPLILFTTLLAFAVIALGAFVRLSNAGLGCPDWPGCYGQITVPGSLALASKEAHARAWIEMIHRYAAGTLGIAILLLAWIHRAERRVHRFAFGLVALLIFQALLGMWTVTWKLMPLVVMGHLLGGLAILALSWWWYLRGSSPRRDAAVPLMGIAALSLLIAQVALGGWTSANYAAIACPDLPTCQGRWWPEMDLSSAFRLPEVESGNYEGGGHEGVARTAIHFTHRVGALVVITVGGLFAFAMRRRRNASRAAQLLVAALLLQFSLGLANIAFHFPLALAVAHTAGAALLLLSMLFALHTITAHEA